MHWRMIKDWVLGRFYRTSWNIRAWWYNGVVLWWKYERTGTPRPTRPIITMKDIVYAPLVDLTEHRGGSPIYGSIKDLEIKKEEE